MAFRTDSIKEQTCNARDCIRLGRGRFCAHHRSVFRYYGAPVAGPDKRLLAVHQRYLKKTLGPLPDTDPEVHRLVLQASDIAFEPRPMHFKGTRPSKTLWASYEAVTGQVLRIRQCHPGETNEQLSVRLWWAFMAVQYLEMSSTYVHQDRHHFWTSVIRLLLSDSHGQKPSSRYADYLDERLNKLLSAPCCRLVPQGGSVGEPRGGDIEAAGLLTQLEQDAPKAQIALWGHSVWRKNPKAL